MTHTAFPDEEDPSKTEEKDLRKVLRRLRLIRSLGGWGTLTITLHAGDLCEIETAYTEKVKSQSVE